MDGITRVAAKKSANTAHGFDVTLASKHPALYVWLEVDGCDAWCSDSFFDMPGGEPRTITVVPQTPMNREAFLKALRVRSLFDTSD